MYFFVIVYLAMIPFSQGNEKSTSLFMKVIKVKSSRASGLNRIRNQVTHIDQGIVSLIGKRFRLTEKIQELKCARGIALHQREREESMLKDYKRRAESQGLPSPCIKKIFQTLFYYSKKCVRIKR